MKISKKVLIFMICLVSALSFGGCFGSFDFGLVTDDKLTKQEYEYQLNLVGNESYAFKVNYGTYKAEDCEVKYFIKYGSENVANNIADTGEMEGNVIKAKDVGSQATVELEVVLTEKGSSNKLESVWVSITISRRPVKAEISFSADDGFEWDGNYWRCDIQENGTKQLSPNITGLDKYYIKYNKHEKPNVTVSDAGLVTVTNGTFAWITMYVYSNQECTNLAGSAELWGNIISNSAE